MSQLAEYLAAHPFEPEARWRTALLSPWLADGELAITTPGLLACDPTYLPEAAQSIQVDVVPGRYLVECRLADFGRDRRVSGIGVRHAERVVVRESTVRGRRVPVDSGMIGLCEAALMRAVWNDGSAARLAESFGDLALGATLLDEMRGAYVVWGAAGFGDGEYPVRRLLDAEGRCVGMRVELIARGERHPNAGDVTAPESAFDPERDLPAAIAEAQARIRERGGSEEELRVVPELVPAVMRARPTSLARVVDLLVSEFAMRQGA